MLLPGEAGCLVPKEVLSASKVVDGLETAEGCECVLVSLRTVLL